MKLTPLADRVILKMVEVEETTKGGIRSPPLPKSFPSAPAAWWTVTTS